MSPERELPVIASMPVVSPEVRDIVKVEMFGGERYFFRLGEDLVKTSPGHREAYERALLSGPSETPDATTASFLLVLRALGLQAERDGFKLPDLPSPIDPSPALVRFWKISDGTEFGVISAAYKEILNENPHIAEVLQQIIDGAPDDLLRIMTETQAKRGAVYAYYGIAAHI